LAAEQQK
jgi:hypothetical protein